MKLSFLVPLVLVASGLVAGAGRSATSSPPDALTLARRTDQALRGRTQQARLSMTVHTPDWERTLEMETWYENPGRTFIRITGPAKEAGTATLRLGNDMWNYLPQVERVIKVPPSLMLEPWMGSDFSNDDLVKESSLVTDYTHQLGGEQQVSGDDCYKLVATPKPGAPVVWGRSSSGSARLMPSRERRSTTTSMERSARHSRSTRSARRAIGSIHALDDDLDRQAGHHPCSSSTRSPSTDPCRTACSRSRT